MVNNKTFLLFCCIVILSISLFVSAEVRVEKSVGSYGQEITFKNEFLSATFVPEWGGRISSLIDNKTGADLVFWDYPPDHPHWRKGLGGALDDRYGLDLPYEYTIKESADAVSITLEALVKEKELLISKTITLAAGSSMLQVEYRYSNLGQKELSDYELMIRNFFWPSGGPVNWDNESAFIPSIKSVRELGEEVTHGELKTKFMYEIIPTWNGFIDKQNKRGLAFSFQDDFYRWFYRWVKGDSPTYEWTFSPLGAGKEVVTKFTIGITHGLDSYIDIAEAYAASLDLSKAGAQTKATYKLFPTKRDLSNCVIKTSFLNLDREYVVELADINLGAAKVGETAQLEMFWDLPQREGIIIQKVYDGQILLGEYEIPVPIKTPPAKYEREKLGRQVARIEDIPGWSSKSEVLVVQPQDKDYQRGYMIYLDYFAPNKKQRGIDIENTFLTLGREEFESLAVNVRSFKDIGEFKVISDDPRVTIKVQIDEELDGVRSGFDRLVGQRLIKNNTFKSEVGKDSRIWLIWDGRGLEPGLYTPVITFVPKDGPPKNLVLAFNIVDIKVPDRNILEFETEGYIFRTFGRMYDWDLNKVKLYIDDLGEHRVNVASIFNSVEKGFMSQMKVKPRFPGDKMEPGNSLDLSSLDPWFDEMIDNGLVRAYVRQNGLQERTEIEKWRMQETSKYLAEKGYPYRDRYVKFVDEMPSEYYPQMAEIGKMYQDLDWRVMHTTLPVKSSIQMSVLNPYTDIWHGPIPRQEDVKLRLAEGNLDPEDELWIYKGWGAVWESYASRRSYPWLASGYRLNGVHLHVYYRGSMNEAIIFPTPNGPDASAAWEGIRDGIEDVQYFELAKQWVQNLNDNGYHDENIARLEKRMEELEKQFLEIPQDGYNYPELLALKYESLSILEELKQYQEQIKISILYGFDELIVDDVAQFALCGNETALETLKEKFALHTKANLEVIQWDETNNSNIILPILRDSDLCKQLSSSYAIEVTSTYPTAGNYSIFKIENPQNLNKWILLIVGGDEAGLIKGCNNLTKFFRVIPQMF